MLYDFDPRTNKENLNSKSYPRRLLEDILTAKIVEAMSFGTASNYLTNSYGSNHRILYEGVARLLADVLIGTLDNIDDTEYTQLRAEFVATRLMYLIFPTEDSVPQGDTHEETISFLLKTYEALLKGATKKSIDQVLNNISEGNAVVLSNIEGYIANIKSAILATTEYNTDGVVTLHRHFTFTDESGLGSTNKPIEYQWGEDLHTHDIIDGVIQPYTDQDGNTHTHEVYLGIPENIVRLQENLRKVFAITKPAHIKTGEVASIIDEDIPLLTQSKQDVFSPLLGIDPLKDDEQIILDNTIDPSLPYYNQNASYGLVGLSLGGLYQDDMRKAREGVYEPKSYGYVLGKKIRFWRTNIKVADTLVIGTQKLRVISISDRIYPQDGLYDPILDEQGEPYTYRLLRSLRRGAVDLRNQTTDQLEVVNGNLLPIDDPLLGRVGEIGDSEILNDGEPLDLAGDVFFCDLMADNATRDALDLNNKQLNPTGHLVRLSYVEVIVDAVISNQGLQLVQNASSVWQTRDQILYETVEFINNPDTIFSAPYDYAINLPAFIVKDMLKTSMGLPTSIYDLQLKVNGIDVDLDYHILALEHTTTTGGNTTNPLNHVMRVYDYRPTLIGGAYTPLALIGDTITLTYPKAKSEIRRFRELNSVEMTLNATRPARKVSLSGRGLGQNRVLETTSPISYVLNEPLPISPFTQEQKIATYSAGSSDLLNTQNQNLNSSYTLNNFSLNQATTQEQVFKPATKTLTTSDPQVFFYDLGFRPSFITSVVDQDQTSYEYTLNQDHLLIQNLTEEKTLTISGLSSNPFTPDQDWYKGERLAEGQAFQKHTSTLELSSFTESTPEEYMTNPLGVDPDKIRSIYSMQDVQTSGVEGELTFYEDVVTGYELDGRDGFTDEYNPHNPQDEILYPDPTLYILGPRTELEYVTTNTIPTYLFFNYATYFQNVVLPTFELMFSIYRFGGDGVKYYQTLTPRADSNGFTAIEETVFNDLGPIAYRLKDSDRNFGVNYANGVAPNYTAEINAVFNHLPNVTYYFDVYVNFDLDSDGFYFFSQGTDQPYALNEPWSTSQEVYQLDGNDFSTPGRYLHEVVFATNPGEVVSFDPAVDPSPNADKDVEDVGLTHTYASSAVVVTNDNYTQPSLGFDFGWKTNFVLDNYFISNVDSKVPSITSSLSADVSDDKFVNATSIVTLPTSIVDTTLVLTPSSITQNVQEITDNVSYLFKFSTINASDTIKALIVNLEQAYQFNPITLSDTVSAVEETLDVPVYARLIPSSTMAIVSDDATARISGLVSQEVVKPLTDDLLVSYFYVPRSIVATYPKITDLVELSQGFIPISVEGTVSLTSTSTAFISSLSLSDTIDKVGFEYDDNYNLAGRNVDGIVLKPLDDLIVPIYQTLEITGEVRPLTELLATSIFINKDVESVVPEITYAQDFGYTFSTAVVVPSLSDNYDLKSYFDLAETLDPINSILLTDYTYTTAANIGEVTIPTDDVQYQLTLNPLSIGEENDEVITFNADAVVFISGTNQVDTTEIALTDASTAFISGTTQTSPTSVSVNDDVELNYVIVDQKLYVYMGVRFPNGHDLTYQIHVYDGEMDTLVYGTNLRLLASDGRSYPMTTSDLVSSAYSDFFTWSQPNIGSYANAGNDASIRVGPLERDRDYTLYFQSQTATDSLELMKVAFKRGGENEDHLGYLTGETYYELGPNTSITQTTKRYFWYHSIRLRRTEGDVLFTQDTTLTEPADLDQTTTVYFYTKNLALSPNDRIYLQVMPMPGNYTYDNFSTTFEDFSTKKVPTIHSDDSTFYNFIADQDPTGDPATYWEGQIDDANTNNWARLSYVLDRERRYLLKMWASPDTLTGAGFDLFIRTNPTADGGASYRTVYNSSSNLNYTRVYQKDNATALTVRHFFTIRQDGFIIWEHDPNASP